jgi:hypothetical protein
MSAQIKPTTATELVPVTVENLPGPRAIFFSLASWRGGVLRLPKPRHPCPWDVNAAAVLNSANVNPDHLAFGALTAATCPLAGVHTPLSRIPKL